MSNLDKAAQEITKVMKECQVKTGWELSFPQYKILPEEVRLALIVLEKHGMKVSFTLKPLEDAPKKP